MTDAPEKIWAEPDGETLIIHNGDPDLERFIATGYLHEYTRTDISQAKIAELEAALAKARNNAFQEAIGCCCPHVDDDQMDAQAKTQCADAIAALKAKP
jgi:hypothetical protein